MEPNTILLGNLKDNIEKNLISGIEKAMSEVSRMKNILEVDIKLKEIQSIYQTLQKVGYSYDFEQKKILDPLNLSITLKSVSKN